MKRNYFFILCIYFLATFFVFGQGNKITSSEKFEQSVFYEIFPSIIDALYQDIRLIPPPPPPPNVLEKKGYDLKRGYSNAYEDWKNSDEFKSLMKKWEKKRDSLESDTTSIYLVIHDSTTLFKKDDFKHLAETFKDNAIHLDSSALKIRNGYKIQLEMLKTKKKKIKFKYTSSFPSGSEIWKSKYDFNIAASLNFSRILFDQTKSFGVLNVGYVMGRLNGFGVRIFIRKTKNGDWVIERISETWIS